ncbi:MAG: hypothetical protein WC875_01150 [Candidatus Absconditabacterales bacterium]
MNISVFAEGTSELPDFCQNTTICGSAPKEFTMIMDFSRELLNSIKTIGPQGDYLGKYVNPNRFEGDKFVPPQQNIISKGVRNVVQKLDFMAATTAILTSPQQWGGVKDLLAGFVTLFKSNVFERDLKVVEQLDAALTEKRYQIGLAGGWYEQINDANRKKIQGILDKYTKNGLLTSASIDDGTTYNNVTAMVGRIVTAMKSFLSFDASDQFSSWSRGGDTNDIHIYFSLPLIASMQQQYSCARGSVTWPLGPTGKKRVTNICDEKYSKFSANRKKMGGDFSSSRKKSLATITDAVQRLKDALKGSRSFKLKTNIEVKNPRTEIKAFGTGFVQNWRAAIQESKKAQTTALDKIQSSGVTLQTIAVDATATADFNGWITQSMAPLFTDQAIDLQSVEFSDVKDFSSLFGTLGNQILLANQILGDKDTNGMLIKELGAACELQCQNVRGKCW